MSSTSMVRLSTKALVTQVIVDIFNKLQQSLASSELCGNDTGSPDLVSISLIGAEPTARRIDRVMDFDLVLVLKDPMTIYKYNEVERIFSALQDESRENIIVKYALLAGPIKPAVTEKYTLFMHGMLFTVNSYQSTPATLTKYSWQREERILRGRSLRDVENIQEIGLNDILDGLFGIRQCKEMLMSRSSWWLTWEKEESNDKMFLKQLSYELKEKEDLLEFCYYSVLRGASNALRYAIGLSRLVGIDQDDLKFFSQKFKKFKYRDLPLQFYKEKVSMRQGVIKPQTRLVDTRIRQSIDFLSALEDELITNYLV
jgi:hypothetical protein